MGNDQSTVLDDSTPTIKLEERNLASVAKLIKDGQAKRIVVMTGAGLSTAAGIPDFRSPQTGLYANLARLNLPTAESVFDIDYFRTNPDPFYVLAKELYPGNYHPTVSHVFISLLAKKGLLSKLYTQNIDCLERQAGVPDELVVEAHGSFATQRCIDCKNPFPDDVMKEHVFSNRVPRCAKDDCDGLVKPDIVFFGESLPPAFFHSLPVLETADLALVVGTSLTVHPFASLVDRVADDTPRVLFNMEQVGSLGTRPDDVLSLGDCNMGICALADHLGWMEELNDLWRETVGEEEAERQLLGMRDKKKMMMQEMRELTRRMGTTVLDDKGEDGQGGDSGADQLDESQESRSGASPDKHGNTPNSDSISDNSDESPRETQDTTLASEVVKPDLDEQQQDLEVTHDGRNNTKIEPMKSVKDLKSKDNTEISSNPVSPTPETQAETKGDTGGKSGPQAKPATLDEGKTSIKSSSNPLL